MDSTGKALVDHWQWAADKGLMNTTTARLIRNSCFQVLSAQEGWENLPVQDMDGEEAFRRFQNLHGRNLTPGSLKDYRRRFVQGLKSFLDYLRDPSNWKGPVTEKPGRPDHSTNGSAKVRPRKQQQIISEQKKIARASQPEELIAYPFPIRSGLTAQLSLPSDLTLSEAKRLGNFIASLAIDCAADSQTEETTVPATEFLSR
jgi:hypothetical protein